jgi:hypothetical protein
VGLRLSLHLRLRCCCSLPPLTSCHHRQAARLLAGSSLPANRQVIASVRVPP